MKERTKDLITSGLLLVVGLTLGVLGSLLCFGCGQGLPWLATGLVIEDILDSDSQQGEPGVDGEDGEDGKDGAIGPAGPQGEPGITTIIIVHESEDEPEEEHVPPKYGHLEPPGNPNKP